MLKMHPFFVLSLGCHTHHFSTVMACMSGPPFYYLTLPDSITSPWHPVTTHKPSPSTHKQPAASCNAPTTFSDPLRSNNDQPRLSHGSATLRSPATMLLDFVYSSGSPYGLYRWQPIASASPFMPTTLVYGTSHWDNLN